MQANVLSKSQSASLKHLVGGIRRDLDRAVRESQAAFERANREQTRARVRAEKQRAQYQILFAKRMEAAVRGCRTLIELGRSPEIQKLIAIQNAQRKLANYTGWVMPAFPFYFATRPSGDAWDLGPEHGQGTRDVQIELRAGHINILWGCLGVDPEEVEIPYASTDDQLGEALLGFAFVGNADSMLALDENQRTYEWGPDQIVFQVFVDCAVRSRFKRLLKAAFDCPALAPAVKKKRSRAT